MCGVLRFVWWSLHPTSRFWACFKGQMTRSIQPSLQQRPLLFEWLPLISCRKSPQLATTWFGGTPCLDGDLGVLWHGFISLEVNGEQRLRNETWLCRKYIYLIKFTQRKKDLFNTLFSNLLWQRFRNRPLSILLSQLTKSVVFRRVHTRKEVICMEYNVLTIGLLDTILLELKGLISRYHYQLHFTESFTVQDAGRLLNRQAFHLLIADLDYLRSIQHTNWLTGIQQTSFAPVIILSDTPEKDINGMIQLGADMCISGKWPCSMIADLAYAQLRRYTEYKPVLSVCVSKCMNHK